MMVDTINNIPLIQSDLLKQDSSLFHFTTTRKGGVSKNVYSSFNMGLYSGDLEEDVIDNRHLLAKRIGVDISKLLLPYQTHGQQICIVDEEFMSLTAKEQTEKMNGVDAMVTNIPRVCIGVTTADCVPVLLYDPTQKVLATVHAGWRGTVLALVHKSIDVMKQQYKTNPADILAYVGPYISQRIFEVGADVVLAFEKTGFDLSQISYVNPQTNKHHIDLGLCNQILLQKGGVLPENIDSIGMCTYMNNDLLYSARKETIKSGRLVTGGYIL